MIRPTLSVMALLLAACEAPSAPGAPDPVPASTDTAGTHAAGDASEATATLEPYGGGGVEGTVRLTGLDDDGGVRVVATVSGLGEGDAFHALHVLAAMACDDLDLEPAHFDPDGASHGPFDAPAGSRHAGDLGNIRAYDGAGRYDRVDHVLALTGRRSALGRAVVVRAGPDDAWSPNGAAGEVVACGVIR